MERLYDYLMREMGIGDPISEHSADQVAQMSLDQVSLGGKGASVPALLFRRDARERIAKDPANLESSFTIDPLPAEYSGNGPKSIWNDVRKYFETNGFTDAKGVTCGDFTFLSPDQNFYAYTTISQYPSIRNNGRDLAMISVSTMRRYVHEFLSINQGEQE